MIYSISCSVVCLLYSRCVKNTMCTLWSDSKLSCFSPFLCEKKPNTKTYCSAMTKGILKSKGFHLDLKKGRYNWHKKNNIISDSNSKRWNYRWAKFLNITWLFYLFSFKVSFILLYLLFNSKQFYLEYFLCIIKILYLNDQKLHSGSGMW